MDLDFERRTQNFTRVEEAAVIAAMDEARVLNPEMDGVELMNEVLMALMAGSWRATLTLNENQPFTFEQIKKAWIDAAKEFANNNRIVPKS